MKAQGEEPENPESWDGRHYKALLEVSTALAKQPDIHAVSRGPSLLLSRIVSSA
jgi:hypothetical protein